MYMGSVISTNKHPELWVELDPNDIIINNNIIHSVERILEHVAITKYTGKIKVTRIIFDKDCKDITEEIE